MIQTGEKFEDPQDFLSLSVSLVDILRKLEKKDILNCKLVSRGLNELIERNNIYFPRIKARLHLVFTKMWTDGNIVRMRVVTGKGLEEKEWKCTLMEHKPIDIHEESENHSISRHLGKCEMQMEEEDFDNHQYGNLLYELKIVLAILFRRYNFAEISVVSRGADLNVQEDYCTVICKLYRSYRSKSTSVYTTRIAWPVVKKLQTQLDICSLSLCYMNDIQLELPSILTRRHQSIWDLTGVSSDVKFTLINTVLKEWERGECCFKDIHLSSTAQYNPVEPEMCGYLKSQRWFDMKCTHVGDTVCTIQFKREMDDRILNVLVDMGKERPVANEYYFFAEE